MRFQTESGSTRDADRDAERDPLDTHPGDTSRPRADDATSEEVAANETDVVPADAGDTSAPDRDRDGVPDDEDPDDATAEAVDRDGDGVPDDDRFVEPAPAPTAFGASTVGGAVAASAAAGRNRTEEDLIDEDRGDGRADDRADRAADHDRADLAADDDRADLAADDDRADLTVHDDRADLATDDDRADDHAVGVAAPPPGASVDPATAGAPVAAVVPVAVAAPERGRAVPVEEETGPVRIQAGDRDGDGTPDADEPDGGGDDLVAWPPEPAMEPAGPAAAAAPASLWADGATDALRGRWREVQLRFVDDPRGATDEAQALVNEAIDTLTAALAERRSELDGWRSGDGDASGADTETERLRVAVRGYRDFLDRLLGL
jgi:hypothetical protein